MKNDTFSISIYDGHLRFRARYKSSTRAEIYLPSDRQPLELVLKEGKWCFTGIRTMTLARRALLRAWVAADLHPERKQLMSQKAKRHVIPTEDYRYVTYGDKLLRLSPINFQRFLSHIEQSKAEAIDWNSFDWNSFRPLEISSPPLPLEGFTSAGATVLLNGGNIQDALKAGLAQHEEAEIAEQERGQSPTNSEQAKNDWQFSHNTDLIEGGEVKVPDTTPASV